MAVLQQSVGNHAVSAWIARLRTRRAGPPMLQRLPSHLVTSPRYKKLYKRYCEILGADKEDHWNALVNEAEDLDELTASVEASIAEALAQRPAAASSSSTSEKGHGKKKGTPLDLSGPPGSNWKVLGAEKVKAAPAGGVVHAAPKQIDVSEFTKGLEEWLPSKGHHGTTKTTELGIEAVDAIVDYATKSYSRRDVVSVFKGIGSGAKYGGRPQLKIIHKNVPAPGSDKQSTYHFTLTQKVYDQLAVPELK